MSPAGNGPLDARPAPDPQNHESRLPYREAEKKLNREPNRAEEQLNGVKPGTGKRNRCYPRNRVNPLLPRCPGRRRRPTGAASSSRVGRPPRRPSLSSISFEGRLSGNRGTPHKNKGIGPNVGFSGSSAISAGRVPPPATTLVCSESLRNRESLLANYGFSAAVPYSATVSSKFGNGHLGQATSAADVPVATANRRGAFTTSLADAEILALARQGAQRGMGSWIPSARTYISRGWAPMRCFARMPRGIMFSMWPLLVTV